MSVAALVTLVLSAILPVIIVSVLGVDLAHDTQTLDQHSYGYIDEAKEKYPCESGEICFTGASPFYLALVEAAKESVCAGLMKLGNYYATYECGLEVKALIYLRNKTRRSMIKECSVKLRSNFKKGIDEYKLERNFRRSLKKCKSSAAFGCSARFIGGDAIQDFRILCIFER